jgi:hypothetical protein
MNHRSIPFLFLLAAPLFAQGEVDLKTTAKKGSSVWLSVERKSEETIDAAGREMERTQSTTRVLHVAVKDVDDKGNLVVETKIARVHGNMSMGGQADFDFDSAAAAAGDDDDGMGGMFSTMKKALMAGAGKTFTAKVDSRGKVVELMDGAAELLRGNQGGMMSGNSLDEGTLKNIVEAAFGNVPEKPMAVGSKWEHKETDGRMPMEHKLEMTLTKADDEAFEVSATGTIDKPAQPADAGKDPADLDPQEAMAREAMRSMKVKNGKMAGSQRVSRKDGFVLDASSTVTMDIEMTAPGMGEMSVAAKVTSVTKRTTADAAEAKKAENPAGEPKKDAPNADPAKAGGK